MMMMRVLLAIALNAALLAVLLPWLRRQWQLPGRGWRAALVVGLGGRLLLGGLKGLNLTNDSAYMSFWANVLTSQLWASPAAAVQTFLGNELHFAGKNLVFYGMSNTFFFIKLVALLNLASLGTDWLNALYLSAFAFVGAWQAARALARCLPATPAGAGLLAFVVWPSVLVWTAGVTKESVLVGSGAWVFALALRFIYGEVAGPQVRRPGVGAGVLLVALAALHFEMRYFFAVSLLGVLAGLALLRLLAALLPGLDRRRGAVLLLLPAVLLGGAWVASEVSVSFRLNKFTNQVIRVYEKMQAFERARPPAQRRPHLAYPDLRPTTASIGRYAPAAIANALTRPWLGEAAAPAYVAAGLENAFLLALLGWAAWAVARGRAGRLPFALGVALGLHCLVLAFLLGISTPNLGSLSRYRSDLLPYLLLLLLQHDYAAAALRRLGLAG